MTLATLWKYTEASIKQCDILVNFCLSSAIKKSSYGEQTSAFKEEHECKKYILGNYF